MCEYVMHRSTTILGSVSGVDRLSFAVIVCMGEFYLDGQA